MNVTKSIESIFQEIKESESYIAFHVCTFGFYKTNDKFRFHANRKNELKKLLSSIQSKEV